MPKPIAPETKIPAAKKGQGKKAPCSTYGDSEKCEGMPCEDDNDCASGCCSAAMANGGSTCHAVIQGSFCPRALAPKVDYTLYEEHAVDFSEHQNSLEKAGIDKSHYSNDIPLYRGQGGCHVHGFDN